jgi:hypothetical protein
MAHIKGRCEPAYSTIRRLGGVTKTAKLLKINLSSVSRWMVPKPGTNGTIPQRHFPAILKHAARHNIKISLQDLVNSK